MEFEVFERAADAGGRLLKVESIPAMGGDDPLLAGALLLTFDVGRALVVVEASSGTLTASPLEAGVIPPGGWVAFSEEDPWWRILGAALVRCRAEVGSVALQFREDGDNPRVLTLATEAGLIRVAIGNDNL
jgi:hypothetical protein